MNEEHETIERELEKLIEAREAFLAYIDASVPKDKNGIAFDFSQHPTLDAKSVYEHFYKLDPDCQRHRTFHIIHNFHLLRPQLWHTLCDEPHGQRNHHQQQKY